ncbi:DUF1330 domain-containing protein [Oceanospirillum sediminis]|uniref:DUF1330 domain-containing protein n=1 Tax=Oceanospirillum sediminis TaxID=2760088 RepID=A0A839IVF1_9GAMM|nr:DUF1330 domain-containing protein [Oceanospirillum sediminis]MBB1488928.1 DUF1330 domain-containing protein [Oceanospirillum sediminis]
MTCFVIVGVTPVDITKLLEYSARAEETLTAFNGRFIAKGESDVMHGEPEHSMTAIIEFPDKEKAIAWYSSPSYQALIPLREQGMKSSFQLLSQ